ncbi:glycosyltransferase [Salinibius halmophilus]|uniref:glycosyltransferase n=1 Tax=Salinibius halmophilus TaxID=1853216 RepID=UPI000E66631F|nr:glycosyltransferase [Salinibius halmophilus]
MNKVLHITFNMGIGGTESVIENIIEGTRRIDNCLVHEIVCLDNEIGDKGKQLQERGVVIHQLDRGTKFNFATVFKLRQLIRNRGITHIHSHQYTPFVYAAFSSIRNNVKHIFTEHGRHHPDKKRIKAYFINKVLFSSTDQITCISKATKEALAKYEFVDEKRIYVIYNGVAPVCEKLTTIKQLPDKHIRILCVARMDDNKNQSMQLRAFAKLIKEFPFVTLNFVGDGKNLDKLKIESEQLGISSYVTFSGFHKDTSKFYINSDLFWLTSFTEGTSMTILEAYSAGIPVIASNVGGTPEILQNEVNGFLVTPHNPYELIEKTTKLIKDKALYSRISKNNKALFQKHYSRDKMSNDYARLYK